MRSLLCLCLFFSLLLTASGNNAALLITRGDSFDAELKTAQALDAYLAAEKLDPKNPELLIKIAKQYGESMVDISSEDGQRAAAEEALQYAQLAAQTDPNLADAHLAVAICYGRLLGRVSTRKKVEFSREVKTAVDRAIKLDPNSDYAWHILGRWQRSVADVDGLKRGIAKIVYGGIPKSSLEEAAASFEKAVSINPGRLSHHIELGITYAQLGETAKARQSLQKGLSLPSRERDDENTKKRGRETLDSLAR